MFGAANVKLHAVSISADLSKSGEAHGHAEQIDPDEIPSRERRGRLGVEIARAYHQRRDYPRCPPLAGDGLRHRARLCSIQPDRAPDDRGHRGPRRGADQPQGALPRRQHRPALIGGAHPAPVAKVGHSAHSAALRH
jgi:hypothetical protein